MLSGLHRANQILVLPMPSNPSALPRDISSLRRMIVEKEALLSEREQTIAEKEAQLWRVTKPGGTIAIQEPDTAAWGCYPPSDAWDRLKTVIGEVFWRGGGDINAGRRTHAMLQERGAEDVRVRAAIVALAPSHPYLRLPIQFATSLKNRILDGGLMSRSELDEAIAECERVASNTQTIGTT